MNKLSEKNFQLIMKEIKEKIENSLPGYIERLETPKVLKDSMKYSLEAGGKRIRPILLFATLRAFGKDELIGLPVACAIEMIHTYSLIHDDLPSMDNDDLRRGKPTNHKVFGEATAILAGDALLTYSFQILSEINHPEVTPEMKLELISKLAKAAGPEGMVGGQTADIHGEGKQITLEELEDIHKNKTGKLLAYSILAGAILGHANRKQIEKLEQFAYHLGLSFQIRDDILDIEGVQEKIGKPIGSDENKQKVTYPSLLTMAGAKEKLSYHIHEAKKILYDIDFDYSLLEYICDLIATRDH
jgi:geranylgeranyl diphosphate synthase, type II